MVSRVRNWLNKKYIAYTCVGIVKDKLKHRREIGGKKKLLEKVKFDRLYENGGLEEASGGHS